MKRNTNETLCRTGKYVSIAGLLILLISLVTVATAAAGVCVCFLCGLFGTVCYYYAKDRGYKGIYLKRCRRWGFWTRRIGFIGIVIAIALSELYM